MRILHEKSQVYGGRLAVFRGLKELKTNPGTMYLHLQLEAQPSGSRTFSGPLATQIVIAQDSVEPLLLSDVQGRVDLSLLDNDPVMVRNLFVNTSQNRRSLHSYIPTSSGV